MEKRIFPKLKVSVNLVNFIGQHTMFMLCALDFFSPMWYVECMDYMGLKGEDLLCISSANKVALSCISNMASFSSPDEIKAIWIEVHRSLALYGSQSLLLSMVCCYLWAGEFEWCCKGLLWRWPPTEACRENWDHSAIRAEIYVNTHKDKLMWMAMAMLCFAPITHLPIEFTAIAK